MSTQPTAVLVHGAFADASGYAGVIRHLQAQGVPVRAIRIDPQGARFCMTRPRRVSHYVAALERRTVRWIGRTTLCR